MSIRILLHGTHFPDVSYSIPFSDIRSLIHTQTSSFLATKVFKFCPPQEPYSLLYLPILTFFNSLY